MDRYPQGVIFILAAGVGLIVGLLLDQIAWGLIVGAGIGVLVEAIAQSRRGDR